MSDTNTTQSDYDYSQTRQLNGRRVITSSVTEITAENVCDVLRSAINTHALNRSEIDYLWNYRKGIQPILYREKEIRPEINNTVVENRAEQITAFKVGYVFGEPIQYISTSPGEDSSKMVSHLNEFMFSADKHPKDLELGEWMTICGTAFRMVLANPDYVDGADASPFNLYTLDPRNSFIVYSTDIDNHKLMGVKYFMDDFGVAHYSVYTDRLYFEIDGDLINPTKSGLHTYGEVPMYEYPLNSARMGAFEVAIPLLDSLNKLDSNRMDGVEQQIQSFLKFINCEIDSDGLENLRNYGAIKIKSTDGLNGDVDTVVTEFDQNQTETLKEDLYDAVVEICSMPNRNGGSSTSDTGSAVWLRDGFASAESWAKGVEIYFKRSERQMLKLIKRICYYRGIDFRLSEIEVKFTRRNYEAIVSKSQVLATLLSQPKVHPLLAFTYCGLFTDPESAYAMSEQYYNEQMEKWNPVEVDENDEGDVSADGEVSETAENENPEGV